MELKVTGPPSAEHLKAHRERMQQSINRSLGQCIPDGTLGNYLNSVYQQYNVSSGAVNIALQNEQGNRLGTLIFYRAGDIVRTATTINPDGTSTMQNIPPEDPNGVIIGLSREDISIATLIVAANSNGQKLTFYPVADQDLQDTADGLSSFNQFLHTPREPLAPTP